MAKRGGPVGAKEEVLLALTRGDPSGVGPELALKAWAATHADPEAPPFLIAAEPEHLAALAHRPAARHSD